MSPSLINQIDRIIEATTCPLTVEDLGDFVFGGFMRSPDNVGYIINVAQVGVELRKHEGLPMAVQIPANLGFFLVAWASEKLMEKLSFAGEYGLDEVEKRLGKIERKHHVHGRINPWEKKNPPPEWLEADKEWKRIEDEIFCKCLQPYAPDIAELFNNNLSEYDKKREEGRLNFAKIVGRDDIVSSTEEMEKEYASKKTAPQLSKTSQRKQMPNPNIVNSGLSQRVTVEGHKFSIEIYKLENDLQWVLEVVDEEGTSIVWDDKFDTDQAALDEVMMSIDDNGIGAFRESANVVPFPKK